MLIHVICTYACKIMHNLSVNSFVQNQAGTCVIVTGISVITASPLIPTGEFPGGPASFVMRRSCRPLDFWDICEFYIKACGFPRGPADHKPGRLLYPVGEKRLRPVVISINNKNLRILYTFESLVQKLHIQYQSSHILYKVVA